MNEIQTAVLTALPLKRKTTPSGWFSFDAPCCHHRGETQDQRLRGGLLLKSDGGFQYNCFNCNYTAGWTPGHNISFNTKNLFQWMGMSQDDILKLNLYALKHKDSNTPTLTRLNFELEDKILPEMTQPISQWLEQDLTQEQTINIEQIKLYLTGRGMSLDWYPWHWSDSPGYKDRVFIPFYHENRTVGWTARKIVDQKPKYLSNSQPGYVFNLDRQRTWDRHYLIMVEGPFDAIAIDGVAILHNEPNDLQCTRINLLNKSVIVVPDRDAPGAKIIETALKYDWAVSLPPWEDDIKDVADAVRKYGRLYTLQSIINYRETNKIKIQLMQKTLKNL